MQPFNLQVMKHCGGVGAPPKQSFESWDGTSQSNLGTLENHSVAKGRNKKKENPAREEG